MTIRKLTDRRGNLQTAPTHNDLHRLNALIGRLEILTIALPETRTLIDERIREAVDAQGQGAGSGISDTVARAADAIHTDQEHHRALNQAIRGIEDKVAHLQLECRRAQGRLTATEPEHVLRCPVMVLLQQTTPAGPEEVLLRCDHLTAHHIDEHGNPINYDPDGYCHQHRADANEAQRRAEDSNSRRQRRFRTETPGACA